MAEWYSIMVNERREGVRRITRFIQCYHAVKHLTPRTGSGSSTAQFFVRNMDLPGFFDGASTNTRARHANTARPPLPAPQGPLLFFFLADAKCVR